MPVVFETDRLYLKLLGGKDAQCVLDFFTRNKDFLEAWEPTKTESFYNKYFQESQLLSDMRAYKTGAVLRLWLFKKDDPERTIGSIAFSSITRGAFCSCYLSYRMDENEINQGYITEAVRRGIRIMFDDYHLHRIEANIMPRNARSLRVVEKLGFRKEGLALRYLKINGVWEDHIHMVLLNE